MADCVYRTTISTRVTFHVSGTVSLDRSVLLGHVSVEVSRGNIFPIPSRGVGYPLRAELARHIILEGEETGFFDKPRSKEASPILPYAFEADVAFEAEGLVYDDRDVELRAVMLNGADVTATLDEEVLKVIEKRLVVAAEEAGKFDTKGAYT